MIVNINGNDRFSNYLSSNSLKTARNLKVSSSAMLKDVKTRALNIRGALICILEHTNPHDSQRFMQ